MLREPAVCVCTSQCVCIYTSVLVYVSASGVCVCVCVQWCMHCNCACMHNDSEKETMGPTQQQNEGCKVNGSQRKELFSMRRNSVTDRRVIACDVRNSSSVSLSHDMHSKMFKKVSNC